MPNYDLQDPTDLDIMRSDFNMYSHEEWQEYIEMAMYKKMGYKNINILKTAQRKAGMAKFLSPKVTNWILSLVEQIDKIKEEEEE